MKRILTVICILYGLNSFSQTDIDCVFNNDYKGLTTEWLNELGMTNFVWNSKTNQAEILSNGDTIFVVTGGCVHFGFLVKLKLTNDTHAIEDSEFWLNKAQTLAEDFELKHYKEMIETKKIERIDKNNNVWFEIEDDNLGDNLYYNGVEVIVEKNSKTITLSKYYN